MYVYTSYCVHVLTCNLLMTAHRFELSSASISLHSSHHMQALRVAEGLPGSGSILTLRLEDRVPPTHGQSSYEQAVIFQFCPCSLHSLGTGK